MNKTETENNKRKAFWQLHISVMLAGFTGLFGKLITLNEVDIVWYRMLFTSLILMVFPSQQPVVVIPEGSNLWWMLCHALFCTIGMYLLQIQALKQLSAFTVNLTYNLEPCYTILLAFLFFGEARELNLSFYVGISLVILSVLLQTRRTGSRS